MRQIFELVSFMLDEGHISRSEIRYLFHLIELWVAAVSNGSLPAKVPRNAEVEEQLDKLERELFPIEAG